MDAQRILLHRWIWKGTGIRKGTAHKLAAILMAAILITANIRKT